MIRSLTRRSWLRAGGASALALGVAHPQARAASRPKRIVFCVQMHGFVHPALQLVPPGLSASDAYELELSASTL